MTGSIRVWCVALVLAGCGTQPSPPGAQRDEPRAAPSPRAAPPITLNAPPPPAIPASFTDAAVATAFGGATPAFPLLSHDGRQVATGIASPIGGSATAATYHVSVFSSWTTAHDAWGSTTQDYPIIDGTMSVMLLDRAMGEPAPLPDPALLASRAATITKLLRHGAFTPFETAVAFADADTLALGPVQVRATRSANHALVLHLLTPSGRQLASQTVLPQATQLISTTSCLATPAPRRAWLDLPRHRLLLEIGWTTNAASCLLPDPEYGIWSTP